MPVRDGRGMRDGFLKARLERALSRQALRALAAAGRLAQETGTRAYLVGGIVRDAILGLPSADLDVVVEGDAEALARALARRIGGVFKKPTEFGTCKVEVPGLGTIDFAASRRETYAHGGALPKVTPSGIEEDLWRRDFTVNAMAVCLNPGEFGNLLDPCGGREDLVGGRLRVMHVASFIDDPTRILRGVRFAARFGYTFDPGTLKLLRASVRGGALETVSGKRVYRELGLISTERQAADAMALLDKHGVLGVLGFGRAGAGERRRIWSGLGEAAECAGEMDTGFRDDLAAAWFASLFAGVKARIARRLAAAFNLPREVRDASLWTSAHLASTMNLLASMDETDAYRIRTMLDRVPRPCLMEMYALSAGRTVLLLEAYLGEWRHVKPTLTGGEISAAGLGQGPQVGRLLRRLLRLRLEGRVKTVGDEVAQVEREVAARRRGSAEGTGAAGGRGAVCPVEGRGLPGKTC